MLTETERQRFRLLQEKEDNQTLDAAEAAEWQGFIDRIEAEEALYLRPATERTRQERLAIEAQNRALKNLIQRRERLARRLERVLAFSNAEGEAISAELAQILAANSPAGSAR